MNKSMFKKHQRGIALLVAVTFAWLAQVSAMPLAAAETTEPAASASGEQAPGFFEQAGDEWGRVRPKTSPLLLLAAFAALSLLYVLIRGIHIDAAPSEGMGASAKSWKRMEIL
jgi:hypothetical protein